MKNLHVEALVENQELVLLHNVLSGAAKQSYGIHVAKIANFPSSVIDDATVKAKELEQFEKENALSSGSDSLLDQFLKDFAALPLASLSPQDSLKQLQQLRTKYSSSYPHLMSLLQSNT